MHELKAALALIALMVVLRFIAWVVIDTVRDPMSTVKDADWVLKKIPWALLWLIGKVLDLLIWALPQIHSRTLAVLHSWRGHAQWRPHQGGAWQVLVFARRPIALLIATAPPIHKASMATLGLLLKLVRAVMKALEGMDERREEEDFGFDRDADEAEPEFVPDAEVDPELYDEARELFGLPPRFTRGELRKAYRELMRLAHPDSGGSDETVQGVSDAYEVILHHHGWAS